MLVVLEVVCADGVESAPKKDNVQAVRQALKTAGQFQYLGLGKDRKGLVLKVRLDKGRISSPGRAVVQLHGPSVAGAHQCHAQVFQRDADLPIQAGLTQH